MCAPHQFWGCPPYLLALGAVESVQLLTGAVLTWDKDKTECLKEPNWKLIASKAPSLCTLVTSRGVAEPVDLGSSNNWRRPSVPATCSVL